MPIDCVKNRERKMRRLRIEYPHLTNVDKLEKVDKALFGVRSVWPMQYHFKSLTRMFTLFRDHDLIFKRLTLS